MGNNNPYNRSQLSYPSPSAHTAFTSSVPPEVRQLFDAVDRDRSGRINAVELQGALVNGQGKNFNLQLCQLMVGMFDKTNSGTIDIEGFQHLLQYVNKWLDTFRGLDRDQSDRVDETELSQVFAIMGYHLTPQFVQNLVRRAEPATQRISADQLILLCIQIEKFTDAFRARDRKMKGEINIGFEDFLSVASINSS